VASQYDVVVNAATSAGGSGMEDVLKRLGALESALSDLKVQVASIASVITSIMPHLATKADINELKADINELKSEFYAREALQLKWLIGTLIASVALACTIAKLVA
jgi:peptidoglycan hydrolase CwlO-like protein